MIDQFKKDVNKGLSSVPKTLSSKYFYDEKGDALFIQIMNMPEYYLTRAEDEIFKNQSSQIIKALKLNQKNYFELIELGAGDGTKTKKILEVLIKEGYQFDYIPIDISLNVLEILEQKLNEVLPEVSVKKRHGDYFDMLASLYKTQHPKVVFFLGSSLGNMSDQEATKFIYKLGANLRPHDKLFIGLDLIKSADIVLPAYNDNAGITKAFNLNLLSRINNELGGNFNLNTFVHQPEYGEKEGIAHSFLVSTKAQEVTLSGLGKTYTFSKNEKIKTEISRKYNDDIVNKIIATTDFQITHKLKDEKGYFANYILTRV